MFLGFFLEMSPNPQAPAIAMVTAVVWLPGAQMDKDKNRTQAVIKVELHLR